MYMCYAMPLPIAGRMKRKVEKWQESTRWLASPGKLVLHDYMYMYFGRVTKARLHARDIS